MGPNFFSIKPGWSTFTCSPWWCIFLLAIHWAIIIPGPSHFTIDCLILAKWVTCIIVPIFSSTDRSDFSAAGPSPDHGLLVSIATLSLRAWRFEAVRKNWRYDFVEVRKQLIRNPVLSELLRNFACLKIYTRRFPIHDKTIRFREQLD